MSENERFLRNEDQPGRAFEAERMAKAQDDEGPDVEGHRLVMANPAEEASHRVAGAEHRIA